MIRYHPPFFDSMVYLQSMVTYDPSVQEMLVRGQDAFVWETRLYPTYERGRRWYIAVTTGTILLVSYAVFSNNFLFAFLILLCTIILILAGNEEAPTVLAQIGELGIVWDGTLYLYRELGPFSLIYHPPYVSTLYVETKITTQPRLRISLEDQDPVNIRQHLLQFLKENTDLQTEHTSDIIGRLLKI